MGPPSYMRSVVNRHVVMRRTLYNIMRHLPTREEQFFAIPALVGNRDSVVGIATCDGLDGSGLEPQWREEILPNSCPSTLAAGPSQPLYNGYPSTFKGIKRSQRGVDRSPRTSAQVRTEYSYASTPLLHVRGTLRRNFLSVLGWNCGGEQTAKGTLSFQNV